MEHHTPTGPVLGPSAAVNRLAQGPVALQWQACPYPRSSGLPAGTPSTVSRVSPDEEIATGAPPGVLAQPAPPALVGQGDRGPWSRIQGWQEARYVLPLPVKTQQSTNIYVAANCSRYDKHRSAP